MEVEESDSTKPTPPAVLNNSENFAAQISLPEGHKMTIGELDLGTLVESATWHGTGRPDESANRFLLSAEGIGLPRRLNALIDHLSQQRSQCSKIKLAISL